MVWLQILDIKLKRFDQLRKRKGFLIAVDNPFFCILYLTRRKIMKKIIIIFVVMMSCMTRTYSMIECTKDETNHRKIIKLTFDETDHVRVGLELSSDNENIISFYRYNHDCTELSFNLKTKRYSVCCTEYETYCCGLFHRSTDKARLKELREKLEMFLEIRPPEIIETMIYCGKIDEVKNLLDKA